MCHQSVSQCCVGVLFSGLAFFKRPSVKVWKLYSVIRIIFLVSWHACMPYIFTLDFAQIPSLHSRREEANKRFLSGLCLTLPLAFSLLPPQRDNICYF